MTEKIKHESCSISAFYPYIKRYEGSKNPAFPHVFYQLFADNLLRLIIVFYKYILIYPFQQNSDLILKLSFVTNEAVPPVHPPVPPVRPSVFAFLNFPVIYIFGRFVSAVSFRSFRSFRFGRFVSVVSFRSFRFGRFVSVVSVVSMVSAVSFRSFRFDVSPFSTCRYILSMLIG